MNLFYRYDYFLIWGHGLNYSAEIIDIISGYSEFEILKIVKYVPQNGIEEFVYEIYNFDYAPFEHLVNKTKYLLTTPCEVLIIFVRNYKPDEEWKGRGSFRHIESNSVRVVKEKIRDMYNEYLNGRRTENHVIHASDNEKQTDYLLKLIGYEEGMDVFETEGIWEQPHHLQHVDTFIIKEVELAKLYARILDRQKIKIVRLDETPHYHAAKGNVTDYENYLNQYRGERLKDFYSINKFEDLINNLDYDSYLASNKYVVVQKDKDDYIICDGLHRASTLLAKDYKKIIVLENVNNE